MWLTHWGVACQNEFRWIIFYGGNEDTLSMQKAPSWLILPFLVPVGFPDLSLSLLVQVWVIIWLATITRLPILCISDCQDYVQPPTIYPVSLSKCRKIFCYDRMRCATSAKGEAFFCKNMVSTPQSCAFLLHQTLRVCGREKSKKKKEIMDCSKDGGNLLIGINSGWWQSINILIGINNGWWQSINI